MGVRLWGSPGTLEGRQVVTQAGMTTMTADALSGGDWTSREVVAPVGPIVELGYETGRHSKAHTGNPGRRGCSGVNQAVGLQQGSRSHPGQPSVGSRAAKASSERRGYPLGTEQAAGPRAGPRARAVSGLCGRRGPPLGHGFLTHSGHSRALSQNRGLESGSAHSPQSVDVGRRQVHAPVRTHLRTRVHTSAGGPCAHRHGVPEPGTPSTWNTRLSPRPHTSRNLTDISSCAEHEHHTDSGDKASLLTAQDGVHHGGQLSSGEGSTTKTGVTPSPLLPSCLRAEATRHRGGQVTGRC